MMNAIEPEDEPEDEIDIDDISDKEAEASDAEEVEPSDEDLDDEFFEAEGKKGEDGDSWLKAYETGDDDDDDDDDWGNSGLSSWGDSSNTPGANDDWA